MIDKSVFENNEKLEFDRQILYQLIISEADNEIVLYQSRRLDDEIIKYSKANNYFHCNTI